ERIQETSERRTSTPVQRAQELHGGLCTHALQIHQLLGREAIKIGRRSDEAGVNQLIDQLRAQTFDVHCSARREVPNRLLSLGSTNKTSDTASHRFALGP